MKQWTSGPTVCKNNDMSLADEYVLSKADIDRFNNDGWVLLRSVCSPEEIATYEVAIRSAALQHNRETRPLEERDTYGKAFLQIMNLWRVHPKAAEFTLARRFASIAARLLKVDRVRLYHDQALFKEPGGGPTPWHQDGFFWPLDQAKTVTMWMPLVDVPIEMGSMSFADGSHKGGIISLEDGISDASEAFYEQYVCDRGLEVRTSGEMRAGDATFHTGLTLHKAPNNPTDRLREVMTIIYFADGQTIQEPKNDFQANDVASWFPGLKPGDLAASELNPVL